MPEQPFIECDDPELQELRVEATVYLQHHRLAPLAQQFLKACELLDLESPDFIDAAYEVTQIHKALPQHIANHEFAVATSQYCSGLLEGARIALNPHPG